MKETLSDAAKSSTKLQEVWRKTNIPFKMKENIHAALIIYKSN